MATKEATEEELRDIWEKVETFWDSMPNKLEFPWVEAKFKVSVFRTTVSQKGLRIPHYLGV